mmetsp:Transcript_8354/g.16827  ORF Transcript_8354/g.16827 Transcript_8354/m.16827 type:complete len:749 (-) Transcript_8354:217-2463(-)
MDLLSGYNSSDSDGDGNNNTSTVEHQQQHQQQQQQHQSISQDHETIAPDSGRSNGGHKLQPPALRRPHPGALNAAPFPSVPLAVLRSKGVVPGHDGVSGANGTANIVANSSSALILTNNPTKSTLHSAIQGPALLCDPHDKSTSFLRSIDPKTGSTSKMEGDAAVDAFSFDKNRTAFQRGRKKGGVAGSSSGGDAGDNDGFGNEDVALAPGEVERVIERNDYGHERRFPPNYGVIAPKEDEADGDEEEQGGSNHEEQLETQQPMQLIGQKRTLPALASEESENAIIVANQQPPKPRSRRTRQKHQALTEGPLVHDSDDEVAYGIWAPPSATERKLAAESIPAIESGVELHPRILAERSYLAERDRQRGLLENNEDNEKEKFDRLVERKMAHLLPPRLQGENPTAIEPSTTFHGSEELDYRGRSWISPPSGVKGVDPRDMDDHACYVPKKCVHRFTGHSAGVHRIRLFPRTGHLLLSAGLDGSCKVWSTVEKKLMRTYVGHDAAVRDVQFNSDGTKFLSASFDRYLRLWDTESGKVLGTYTNRRVPYVVQFYPHDDNLFVVGCSDNKIVTYDATTGEITQEYDHHLAPVNTITFVEDQGTKMVTSSDDKKVLVWEWDIGVPIKYISDPTMHSMPVITMHPSEKYLICQSLDNKLVVYQAGDRYTLQRKKKFEGHNVAGYACDIGVSPDGRFVCSGDSDGKLFFWDFKRTKMLQKYRAHEKGPCVGCVWHPVETSVVFSCGWDGVIKMWQ